MWRKLITPKPLALALLMVAAVAYSLLSIVNHINFHTFGLDLGLYTHALYDYSHFHASDGSFYLFPPRNLLADHFDLYLVLLSPLTWLFGQYTFLVVQIAAVLLGAAGVYKLMQAYDLSLWIALAAMAAFLSFFGVWQALAFDYHSNVVGTMLVPWLMYSLKRQRYVTFFLLTMLICLGKETLPFWLAFVMLALMWDYRRDRTALCWLGAATAFCVLYLLVVSQWIMPSLSDSPAPGYGRYHYMGDSFGAVAQWILTHPIQAVGNLFANFSSDAYGYGLKPRFFVCLLLSGGLLCVGKPHWLLMMVPLVVPKMLADDIAFWGVSYHYNVEYAVVLIPATFMVASGFQGSRLRTSALVAATLMPLLVTAYTCYRPSPWIGTENVRLFDGRHYRQEDFSRAEATRMMDSIPADASVCASSCLTPHLALRDSVYLFPAGIPYRSQYVMLTANDKDAFEGMGSADWQAVDSAEGLILFKLIYKQ